MTPTVTPLPQPGMLVAGKYRVEAQLGRGGMGAVFRAVNTLTGRTVALKWLLPEVAERPDARARFLREARAASRIAHPNVVDVYDVVDEPGGLFLVMEYLEGTTLAQRLDGTALSPAELPALFFPVLEAVIAAHARGVIHRDLKPDNVFVCPVEGGSPRVVVLDFGISKLAEEGRDTALTRSGVAVGTPRYMCVEQLAGERELDARVDVYALGVMLYEALTGVPPFDGDSYGAIAIQVATATPKRPRELCASLPEGLEAIVLKAMERNRDLRYRRVQDMLDALSQLLSAPGEARTESMPVPVQALAQTVPQAHEVGARAPKHGLRMVLVLLLVASGLGVWWSRRPAPPVKPSRAPVMAPPARVVAAPSEPPPGEVEAVVPAAPQNTAPAPRPAKVRKAKAVVPGPAVEVTSDVQHRAGKLERRQF